MSDDIGDTDEIHAIDAIDDTLAARTYLVTGATAGIGQATARALALRGARVILACRSQERAEATLASIRQARPDARVETVALDLCELDSVRACARELLARGLVLDGLVNNAGIGGRGQTRDGFELHFGVNYLGHFLLTLALLPCLRAAGAARIVNVSSHAHFGVRRLDFARLQAPTASLTGWREYAVSKLANVLFTRALATRLAGSGIRSYALHPGAVATDALLRLPRFVAWLMRFFLLTPEQGAKTTLHCLLSDAAGRDDGLYYERCAVKEPGKLATDASLAGELWRRSLAWTGLSDAALSQGPALEPSPSRVSAFEQLTDLTDSGDNAA